MAVVGAVVFVALAVVLVPWDPVPGGGPSTLPAPDTCSHPEQIARAEAYAGCARWLGWSSLVVSLVVVCWLGLHRGGRAAGRPAARLVVGAGRARRGRSCRWSAGWPRCRSPSSLPPPRLDYGLSTQAWPDWLRDVAVSWASTWSAAAWCCSSSSAPRARWRTWWPAVAGGDRGRLGDAGLVRLSRAGRAAVQHLHPAARRAAAHGRARAGGRGGRARRRRAGGGRVAAYDDPQCLRVGLRQHAAGGALRQPGARRARRTRCSRSSPTSWRTRGTTTCSPGRCSARPGPCWDRACSAWCWAGGGEHTAPEMQRTAGDPAVVPLVLALVAVAGLLASPDPERDQPADRDPSRRGRAARPPTTRRRSWRCNGSWRRGHWRT